jgi:hypothetical protein
VLAKEEERGGGRGKRHRWHPFKGEWWGAEDMGGDDMRCPRGRVDVGGRRVGGGAGAPLGRVPTRTRESGADGWPPLQSQVARATDMRAQP